MAVEHKKKKNQEQLIECLCPKGENNKSSLIDEIKWRQAKLRP